MIKPAANEVPVRKPNTRVIGRNRALRQRAREHLQQLGLGADLALVLASRLKFSECAELLGEVWPPPFDGKSE